MRFSDKYYFLRKGETAGNILRARRICKCCVCGKDTPFVEMNYEAFFCSTDCLYEFEKNIPKG